MIRETINSVRCMGLMRGLTRALILSVVLCMPATAVGVEVLYEVVTDDGEPVADAVVSLHREGIDASEYLSEEPLVMDQRQKRFVPKVLPALEGSLVAFPNSDNIRHHVYSFSPAKTFELELYAGRAYEPLVFDTAGVVTLGCNIHDRMIGFIYVLDTPWFAKTSTDGQAVLDPPAEEYEVRVWHPRIAGGEPQTRGRRSVETGSVRQELIIELEAEEEETSEDPEAESFEDRLERRFQRFGRDADDSDGADESDDGGGMDGS